MYSYDTDADRYGIHPRDIFICYSDSDEAEAIRVATLLENHGGWTCWHAKRDLPLTHNDCTDSILEIIKECSVFLFISSTNATMSHDVQVAVSHALALDKNRVELKIDDGEIKDSAFHECFQYISRIIEKNNQAYEDFEDEPAHGLGKRLIYILILIIGVTGGVLTFSSLRGEPRVQVGLEYFEEERPDSRRLLTIRAEEGEAAAQYEIGRMLMIIQEFEEATHWFMQAAEQGHKSAQLALAVNYQRGVGISRNHLQAAYWFYQAGETDDLFVQFDIGMMYREGNLLDYNPEQAIYWFRQAAERDLPEAQVHLGGMYYNGQGTQANHELAAYWYRRAADMGDPYAQSNLGIMYSMGHGVSQSYDEAVNWYRMAANQNMPGAQVNLGWMYEFGFGVDIDLEQAVYWYQKAAELGNASAQSNYGIMLYSGRGVPQNYELAVHWFRQAAQTGDPRGAALLGYMYENGTGVESDAEMAVYWYLQALQDGPDWVAERLHILLNQQES